MQGVCAERKALYKQASAQVAKLEKELEKAQKPTNLKKTQLKNLKTQVLSLPLNVSVVHMLYINEKVALTGHIL